MPPKERTKPLAEQVLNSSGRGREEDLDDPPVTRFLSTGCSVLNCLLSDRVDGGWPSGRISNLIGDSDTAKTVLGMHALAEACQNKDFDDYLLIYADIESALTSSTKAMFGRRVQDRASFLHCEGEKREDRPPETVEELHYQWMNLMEEGRPFIYVVDSLDFLPSQADLDKTQEQKKAWESGKESKGTYQMSKQKRLKAMLREMKGKIGRTDSIILIISQTIDNIGSMFDPKTVAGGNALEFASRIRVWLSKLETDKVGKRVIGRKVRAKVSKNHITGHLREAPIWVYNSYGVVDTKTSIDFLVAEGAWPKVGGWVIPEGLYNDGQKFQVRDLISKIEADKRQRLLGRLVQKKWDDIEASLKLNWERRYE